MNNKEFNQYLCSMEKYIQKVLNKEISPEESLNSLIKAGICNKNKEINKPYIY